MVRGDRPMHPGNDVVVLPRDPMGSADIVASVTLPDGMILSP